MTSSRVTLESFEDATAAEPRHSAEYTRGFAEGEKFAHQSQAADLTGAVQSISATLSDMTFGYTEARVLLLDRIRPLLAQVAEAVLPLIAREGFAEHLVDVLTLDFEALSKDPIEIAVSTHVVDHLSEALAEHRTSFVFVADPALVEGQALLKSGDRHIMIDLPSLVSSLQTALNGLEPIERTQSHG